MFNHEVYVHAITGQILKVEPYMIRFCRGGYYTETSTSKMQKVI